MDKTRGEVSTPDGVIALIQRGRAANPIRRATAWAREEERSTDSASDLGYKALLGGTYDRNVRERLALRGNRILAGTSQTPPGAWGGGRSSDILARVASVGPTGESVTGSSAAGDQRQCLGRLARARGED